MSENVSAPKRKLKYPAGETSQILRERVTPKDGMSDGSRRGLDLLGHLSDRDLFELFFQTHMKQEPVDDVALRVASRMEDIAEVDGETLAVGINRFVESTADLVEEEGAGEDFDAVWERERRSLPDQADELGDLDVLIQLHRRWVLKVRQEESEQPAFLRRGEYEKSVNTLASLIEKRSRVAVAVGQRKAPEQDVNLRLGEAWQTLMAGVDEDGRQQICQFSRAMAEGIHRFQKKLDEGGRS